MCNDFGFQFNNSYLTLPTCFYTTLKPETVPSAEMVIFNNALAQEMDLDFSSLDQVQKTELFSGNTLLEHGGYFAQAYAGHQFGHLAMLGDGRAIVLGEHITPSGNRFDIQFKGSGRTPYSRQGDGKAALGPMLREYIISEAMHYLRIPTTRSLAVVKTGEEVFREDILPGAILTRVANSLLRVGTFEFAALQQDPHATSSLLNYTIKRHYPDLIDADNQAIALLSAVMEQQAQLIVEWMRVGFIHGVMNTDNMTISGETIDYGPCAFIDHYDPGTVFSSIDHAGRYAYQNQPAIAQWNLARLAETLLPLIHDDTKKAVNIAEETINAFPSLYEEKWLSMMRVKLGLLDEDPNDTQLINELLDWMQKNNADFTNTFRKLSQIEKPASKLYDSQSFNAWYERWKSRQQSANYSIDDALDTMKRANPVIIPRNHLVEKVLKAADNEEFQPLYDLLDALKDPYKSNHKFKSYQQPPSPSERVYQTFCGT